MKKLISIFMIISIMILSIGTAFAFSETVTTGLNVTAVEDETGLITVKVSANDTVAIQGVTVYLKLNGVKAVKASDKATEVTAATETIVIPEELTKEGWAVTNNSYKSATNIKAVVGSSTAKVLTNQEIFTAYFVKTDAEATLAADAFAYGTTTAQTSKISYTGGVQKLTKTAADQSYFGLSVTPYTAPGGETWQETIDTKLPTGDDVKFPAAKGEDSTVDNDAKKVVIFAKNTTGDKLVGTESGVANYGITIGGMYYPGFLDVPAGANWSIILVDPNGELTGKSFSASATVGSETKPLSNVSFE